MWAFSKLVSPEAGSPFPFETGDTALHLAAKSGNLEALRRLLATEAGQDVDATNVHGRTALHYAAWRGDAEAVRSLLAAGAAPTLADTDGATPVQAAVTDKHYGLADLLRVAAFCGN